MVDNHTSTIDNGSRGAMTVVYSGRYRVDIGPHVFPTVKYEQVVARLLETRVIAPADILEPQPASWDDLRLVHTTEYLDRMRLGTVTAEDVAQLELPWSAAMVEGFRTMAGGTIAAAVESFEADGRRPTPGAAPGVRVVCHVGGGLHHAFPNHGEGFCPFNDVAVAVRVLQARHGIERFAIVDLDVHHGNGTAFVFNPAGGDPRTASGLPGHDDRVFTFSMHQQHNYPMWKPRGSLDIGLPDGTHDATYLGELERALPRVIAHRPEGIFYLAGADPYEDDQLGGLRLTMGGLRQRDRLVIAAAREAGIPLVVVLAGGYARKVEDTVAIHCATIEEASV
jgi:acetoin utilization deacetylase AcuC-like enzyme